MNMMMSGAVDLEILDKYGYPIFISLILLLILFAIIKWIFKIQNKQIKELQDTISGIAKKFTDEEELKDKFAENSEDSNKIQILIYHILNEFKCGRITVNEYHNGGKSLNGNSFRKCSNTYEAVSLNITPKIREFQNLPISINALWNKLLINKSPILIHDIEDIKDVDYSVYTTLKVDGIKSYYSFLIKDYDDSPLGFVAIEFYNSKVELDDEHVRQIEKYTQIISGLIV